MRKPGRWILLLLVLAAGFYGIQRLVAWRTPPVVTVAAAPRVPAQESFLVDLTASKRVTYSVAYGDLELESTTDDTGAWTLYLPALAGNAPLRITAIDGAGNVVEHEYEVTGVAAAILEVLAPDVLTAGDALAVVLDLGTGPGAEPLLQVRVAANREQLPVLAVAEYQVALGSVPLGTESSSLFLSVVVTDEFGRELHHEASIGVNGVTVPIEVLQLDAETLALMSDENRALEAAMLAEALADLQPDPMWTAPFMLPSTGFASSGFGDPRRYFPDGPVSFHVGSDLAAPTGTPIVATNDGIVMVAEFYPVKGGLVVIDHGGGVTSHYFHQSVIQVEVGQHIARGGVIGEVGSTGVSTGPHLHWEMRVGDAPTNPMAWVGRMLPGLDTEP